MVVSGTDVPNTGMFQRQIAIIGKLKYQEIKREI